jgi:serine/threonine protein kinase
LFRQIILLYYPEINANEFLPWLNAITHEKIPEVEPIGSGAYSIIYPHPDANNPTRAIKAFIDIEDKNTQTLDSIQLRPLFNEVAILWSLRHAPNVVKIYNVTFYNDPRIVMEYADAGDLGKFIHDNSNSTYIEENHLDFMCQILCASSYMHEQNIIHFDIKPWNIVLFRNNNNNTVKYTLKLCDFNGSALKSHLPWKTEISTTYCYAAPEVLAENYSLQSDKSDTYSISIVWIQMFNKRNNPFFDNPDLKIDDLSMMKEAVVNNNLRPTINNVPDACKAILLRMWDKDPKVRLSAPEAKAEIEKLKSKMG